MDVSVAIPPTPDSYLSLLSEETVVLCFSDARKILRFGKHRLEMCHIFRVRVIDIMFEWWLKRGYVTGIFGIGGKSAFRNTQAANNTAITLANDKGETIKLFGEIGQECTSEKSVPLHYFLRILTFRLSINHCCVCLINVLDNMRSRYCCWIVYRIFHVTLDCFFWLI